MYLVPGYYYDDTSGEKQYNTVTGATKLTEEQEAAIFTENVYLAGEERRGVALIPNRKGEDWSCSMVGGTRWMAEIRLHGNRTPTRGQKMYFCMLTGGMTFLSRPIPFPRRQGDEEETMRNYMRITHSDGDVEYIELFESVPDALNAYKKVQFYNEYFLFSPGDVVEFWVSGIYPGEGATRAPQTVVGSFSIKLESTDYSNTLAYLERVDPETGNPMYINEPTDGAVLPLP